MLYKDGVLIKVTEKDIEDGTFLIPENTHTIEQDAFKNLSNLKYINIPDSVTSLKKRAFSNCTSLKSVTLSNNIETLEQELFSNCISLSEITIPDNVQYIGDRVFFNCASLNNIVMSEEIVYIGRGAFEKCTSLKHFALLSKRINNIQPNVFLGCSSLKKVTLPEQILLIGPFAFSSCSSLKHLTLPRSLSNLETGAFSNCTSLKTISLPKRLLSLDSRVFYNCTNLEKISLSGYVAAIAENAFENTNLNYVINAKSCFLVTRELDEKYKDYYKIEPENHFVIGSLTSYWDIKKNLDKDLTNSNTRELYLSLYNKNDSEPFYCFILHRNLTFYNKIKFSPNVSKLDIWAFNKLYYNLGGFLKKPYQDDEPYIAQKVGEFLIERLKDNSLNINEMYKMFDNMLFKGYNPYFTRFFTNSKNFNSLMEEEKKHPGFISNCYNQFSEIQDTNQSNKGNQRHLAPTIEKFKSYLLDRNFDDIKSENSKDILEITSKYFSNKNTLTDALHIDKIRKKKNINDNILSCDLKESAPFQYIEEYDHKITDLSFSTFNIMTNLANQKFTFEWLKKSSPLNFVLGKLCTCCTHLEGTGYGIMKASILHPDVQNLVIRDEKNNIISKATLYVNKKEQYGIFNTIEINDSIQEKEIIYNKYKLAIEVFASRYNEENKNKPLMQINVGMNSNDLVTFIKMFDEKANVHLKAINYEDFCEEHDEVRYNGDSDFEQYILWRNNQSYSKKT